MHDTHMRRRVFFACSVSQGLDIFRYLHALSFDDRVAICIDMVYAKATKRARTGAIYFT